MYYEDTASQYGMLRLREKFPAEIGTEPTLTTEQHTQLDNLKHAYYQDLRNLAVTRCTEYAADELKAAGYTAEQVRKINEDSHRLEYGESNAYREIERLMQAGIISAIEDTRAYPALVEAFGIPTEFGQEAIPGDIVLGTPMIEPTNSSEIKSWNREVVFGADGNGVNLRWVIILQVAHQIYYRYGEQILEATPKYM